MANKYSLVGVDGNAYSVLGYVCNALKESGHKDLIEKYETDAKSGDYNNLLRVSLEYLDICNAIIKESASASLENYEPLYWNNKGKYQKQWDELTDKLVPAMGAGKTTNAELVRGANRLYYDCFNNGNCNVVNCDTDFETYYDYDEDGELVAYEEKIEGDPYITDYYQKFLELFRECGIVVDGFYKSVLKTDNWLDCNDYFNYDKMIDAVYEYVTTHEDKALPYWYKE